MQYNAIVNIKPILSTLLHGAVVSAISVVGAASVFGSLAMATTLSGEKFIEYAPEEAYWVVTVKCDADTEPRIIQRKTDGTQWCNDDHSSYCADTKQTAADLVCGEEMNSLIEQAKLKAEEEKRSAEVKRQLAAQEAAKARQEAQAKRTAEEKRLAAQLQAEEAQRQQQLNINEELLEIEQQKISLRRQELEFQRRLVEIRETLEKLEAE